MKKYFINEEEVESVEFYEKIEDIEIDEEMIEELINDCYESFKFGNTEFLPSEIVKRCDPIMWRCILSEEEDRIKSDFMYDLEHYNETTLPNGNVLRIEENDEE